MDIPLLLGTVFASNRSRASALGYAIHFGNGLLFALVYAAVFAAVDRADRLLGLGLGLVHALFAGVALVEVLLPAVHPRMGTRWSDSRATPVLEPPGFLLLNYGRHTASSRSPRTSPTARPSERSAAGSASAAPYSSAISSASGRNRFRTARLNVASYAAAASSASAAPYASRIRASRSVPASTSSAYSA